MSLITDVEFANAWVTSTCVWCSRRYGWSQKFIRLFWAPWWCYISIYWRICCSSKCHTLFLEQQLEECRKEELGR